MEQLICNSRKGRIAGAGRSFEAPDVEPVFAQKDHAIDYAQSRACFRLGEIPILDSAGKLESISQFNEQNRKL